MQKSKFVFLFAALIGLTTLFTGCKYEEGPAISLRSKKERVANTWKIESAIDADGTNNTSTYEDHVLEMTSEGELTWSGSIISINFSNEGTWILNSDNENIKMNFDNVFAFPFTTTDEFEILKLKEDNLWFVDLDNEFTEFHLVPSE